MFNDFDKDDAHDDHVSEIDEDLLTVLAHKFENVISISDPEDRLVSAKAVVRELNGEQ